MISEDVEIAREKRRRGHLERLGFADPRCIVCGETDVRCLQLDHIAGRGFSDDVAVLCANHHFMRTDLQKDHPLKEGDPEDPMEIIGRFIHGLADFLELLLTRLREYGTVLLETAARNADDSGSSDTA